MYTPETNFAPNNNLQKAYNNLLGSNIYPSAAQNQPLASNFGEIAFVKSFDEIKQKQLAANSKYCFWQKPSANDTESLIYLVQTDDKSEQEVHTYKLDEVPNPEPVRQLQVQELEKRLENKFQEKFNNIENKLTNLLNFAQVLINKKGVQSNGIFEQLSKQQTKQSSSAESSANPE